MATIRIAAGAAYSFRAAQVTARASVDYLSSLSDVGSSPHQRVGAAEDHPAGRCSPARSLCAVHRIRYLRVKAILVIGGEGRPHYAKSAQG